MGVRSERDRIRQDIHDDLGAKLLTLLHRSNSADEQKLVRDAIRDLRDLLSTMETLALSLDEAALQWEQEARQRCDAGGVSLEWHSSEDSLAISVENDGLGQDRESTHEGRGIGIIKQRATRLGGVAGVGAQQGLWWVNVRVPLDGNDRAGDSLPL